MKKIADIYNSFLIRIMPLSFEKLWMKSCQQNISKPIEARDLEILGIDL